VRLSRFLLIVSAIRNLSTASSLATVLSALASQTCLRGLNKSVGNTSSTQSAMLHWIRNPFSRPGSSHTLRTTNRDEESRKDRFTLPTSTKDVEEQSTAPRQLPAYSADTDEVRYFLYHVLTYKGNKIARRWPQWILETCAYWTGTGAELRTWEQDFQLLVPKSAGYVELDKSSKYTDRPPCDCRLLIGNVIERTVKKMIADEGGAALEHQEWIARERGSGPPQSLYSNPSSAPKSNGYFPNIGPQGSSMISGAANCMSLPELCPSQLQYGYSASIHPSLSSHAPSLQESMFAHGGTTYQSIDMSPTSSGDSGFTNSTSQTTPPASFEGPKVQPVGPSRYGTRSQTLHPISELTHQNLQATYGFPSPSFSPMGASNTFSDAGSRRSTLRAPMSQVHIPSNLSYMSPPESLRVHTPISQIGMCQSVWQDEQPRSRSSASTVHSRQGSIVSANRSLQNMHFAEQMQRQGSPVSVRSRASQMASTAYPVPNAHCRPPIGITSLNYPQPDISNPRNRPALSIAPSAVSLQPRRVASSILNDFPTHLHHERPQVPGLSSFTSADRSHATAGVDQLALQQGAYHYMRATDPAKAYEVALKEKARMQGMMTSNLRRHGREPLGPSMRAVDPVTNVPALTLYEVLEAKEILQGKGNRM